MTAASTASKKGALISRALCAIAVVLSGLLAGCGTMNFDMEAKPTAEGLPQVNKSALRAGVYYSPQFASHVHLRRTKDANYHMHIGAASASYFDQVLPRLFESTSRVDTLAPEELAKKDVDLVVAVSLEHFDFPLGMEPYSERFGVAYRATLYTPRGVPVSSWVVYGTANHWKMFGGHIEAYIQQAGERFVRTFEQQSAPGLAAVAASRQRAPDPIDVAALQLSAWHAQPFRLGPGAIKQLRDEGFAFVEVDATPKTSKAIVVRASDMQLRLSDGRMIESSSPSALLLIATRGAATPVVAGMSPLLGLAASLAVEASTSLESEKRRESLQTILQGSFFGERVLQEGKNIDRGTVFFRLPPKASIDGARLVLWALDPATAAGSQVEMPLGGAPSR